MAVVKDILTNLPEIFLWLGYSYISLSWTLQWASKKLQSELELSQNTFEGLLNGFAWWPCGFNVSGKEALEVTWPACEWASIARQLHRARAAISCTREWVKWFEVGIIISSKSEKKTLQLQSRKPQCYFKTWALGKVLGYPLSSLWASSLIILGGQI